MWSYLSFVLMDDCTEDKIFYILFKEWRWKGASRDDASLAVVPSWPGGERKEMRRKRRQAAK